MAVVTIFLHKNCKYLSLLVIEKSHDDKFTSEASLQKTIYRNYMHTGKEVAFLKKRNGFWLIAFKGQRYTYVE